MVSRCSSQLVCTCDAQGQGNFDFLGLPGSDAPTHLSSSPFSLQLTPVTSIPVGPVGDAYPDFGL